MTIKKGSTGNEVKKIQQFLGLTADGSFGLKTEEAVKSWQAKNGLVADGIIGDKTWVKMFPNTSINTINTTNTKCIDSNVIYKPLSVHISNLPNRKIKYLVIHFTAGSSSAPGKARACYNVFTNTKASADFAVDDRDMVQFNPDIKNYYCWAVGGSKYANTKGASYYNKATNSNCVSIEICSTCKPATKDTVAYPNHSAWGFTDASLNNAIKLAKIIMKTYNIPIENVIRHYDVTGKYCPGIIGWNNEVIYDLNTKKFTTMYSTSSEWEKFKNQLK